MALFGTSGIRMECPAKLTAALAMKVGQAAASAAMAAAGWLEASAGKKGCGIDFVVGFDGRPTGGMIKAAVAAGAASVGANVIDIGFCATPTLALHTQNVSGVGAMITASHNPPEYNGIKLFENGREADKKIENGVEFAVAGRAAPVLADWKNAGQVADGAKKASDAHKKLILNSIDVKLIAKKNPKVVLDCGNAAGAALMPQLLEEAGCTVIAMNSDEPGKFSRGLEPTEANLRELTSEIIACGADFGIAHDGDADRAIIFDERGKMLGLDRQLAIAVQEMIEKNKTKAKNETSVINKANAKTNTIVSTVESSISLREIVEGAGWRLEITPVGSLFVAQKMREGNAAFGGEPCGEYIFPGKVQMPDGLMVGLFFAEIFCRKGKLSQLAEKIKTYPMLREKMPCQDGKKNAAMGQIAKNWPYSKPNAIDGLRSDEKWGWIMVRPSGTEPIIRITLEAKNAAEAKKRMDEMIAIVQKAI